MRVTISESGKIPEQSSLQNNTCRRYVNISYPQGNLLPEVIYCTLLARRDLKLCSLSSIDNF